ncbi:putative oligopeptide transporter [Melampsora americana]|nr:putative oligopeptide transporter [Melampsora americana]
MGKKCACQNLKGLDNEHPCEALPAKQTLKDSYADPVLRPLNSQDHWASKTDNDLSHLPGKVDNDSSDPFDECAVLPTAEEEDDPNEAVITVRSALVGVIMVIFGAAVSQVFMYKPVSLVLNPMFLQLASLVLGKICAAIPGPKWWNPGPLSVKETVFSAIIANSGAGGVHGVEIIASLDVFFDRPMPSYLCVLTILSSQLMGLSWAGLYRSVFIHPKNVSFPSVLPCVALFHSLGKSSPSNRGKLSFFKKVFGVMTIYEAIPEWLAPALQAISPWCLTLPQVPVVTQIFGGSIPDEGLGLFAASLDWVLVGKLLAFEFKKRRYNPLYIPLMAQITDWLAAGTGVFLYSAAYRFNWFGGAHLPFISHDILNDDGLRYNLSRALFDNGTENRVEVEKMGLPAYSTPTIIGKAGTVFSVSSAIVAAILFNWDRLAASCSRSNLDASGECPHRTITKHLPEFPTYGFLALGASSIGLAFFCSAQAGSGLPVHALIVAIVLSAVLSFAAVFFYGTVGMPLNCQHVTQMLGGILFPGNAIGNLWFTLYGWTSVSQCVHMAKDSKLGQYMNISTVIVVTGQITGKVLGGLVHYCVMAAIVGSQREVLLSPHGDGIYTGMALSSMSAQATSWGIFSRRLYFFGSKYQIIPYALLFGFLAPVPFFLLHKWKPKAGFQRVNTSLFAACLYHAIWGSTSGRMTSMILAISTQYYIRKYHFKWYQKYNYILTASLEGGTQFSVLLLTFLVQGGAGIKINIPQ